MDKVKDVVDQVYRNSFGKLVATLLGYSREIDIEMAEDVVHDAFVEAIDNWRKKGTPENKSGWIYVAAKNRFLNRMKRGAGGVAEATQRECGGYAEVESETIIAEGYDEAAIRDFQLKLLFACAHPALAPKTQVVITLKYVVNLKVEAIANVLGMTIDGVDKLLVRARQKIKEEGILLQEPRIELLRQRVPVVHKVIYLVFNEGYKSTLGKEVIRKELCEEALMMNRELLECGVGNKETAALHSLMLFNCARFDSRFDAAGDLVELEHQDRTLWDHDLIQLGNEFMKKSYDDEISSYHIEASIAYVHCTSPDFKSTNWKLIAKLYDRLLISQPNPFVELNYAIALYYSGEKQKGYDILHELQQHPYMNHYFLLNSALGKFYYLDRDYELSKSYLFKSLKQTQSPAEKKLIERHILELESMMNGA
ncbi:MAG TPA: sigma-70 family RNA polymerase sigma factor [Cyclobacteriaceae bacterium]|nr:sigma-70 family RNA polymerase sigma factor [Cyclobacteriaceae bacterium]